MEVVASSTSEWPVLYLLACNEHSVYKGSRGIYTEGAEPLEANKKLTFKTRIIQKKTKNPWCIFFHFSLFDNVRKCRFNQKVAVLYLQRWPAGTGREKGSGADLSASPRVLPDPNSHSTGKG